MVPLNRPIGKVVMPNGRLVRSGFLYEELVEDDIDLCRPEDASHDFRCRRVVNKVSETIVLVPQKCIAEETAIFLILSQLVRKFSGVGEHVVGPST